jgi:hypothetical protein
MIGKSVPQETLSYKVLEGEEFPGEKFEEG